MRSGSWPEFSQLNGCAKTQQGRSARRSPPIRSESEIGLLQVLPLSVCAILSREGHDVARFEYAHGLAPIMCGIRFVKPEAREAALHRWCLSRLGCCQESGKSGAKAWKLATRGLKTAEALLDCLDALDRMLVPDRKHFHQLSSAQPPSRPQQLPPSPPGGILFTGTIHVLSSHEANPNRLIVHQKNNSRQRNGVQ